MARLERIELIKMPEYDDKMIQGLIELREKYGVAVPARRIRCQLIDRTVSEVPQYGLSDDEDLQIWAQYFGPPSEELGVYPTESAAIARCQEHHDSIYGSSL